jgi:hypothetical protein
MEDSVVLVSQGSWHKLWECALIRRQGSISNRTRGDMSSICRSALWPIPTERILSPFERVCWIGSDRWRSRLCAIAQRCFWIAEGIKYKRCFWYSIAGATHPRTLTAPHRRSAQGFEVGTASICSDSHDSSRYENIYGEQVTGLQACQ